jgi:hydrogenase maturation protein HypF
MMVAVAKKSQETRIVLSGGCFQNKYLLERAIFKIREAGLQPYWHQRLPTNDGGISVGQVIAAQRQQCRSSGLTISKPMEVPAGLLSLAAQTS